MRKSYRAAVLFFLLAGGITACGGYNDSGGSVQTEKSEQILNFSNFTSASLVIGQPDFASNASNQGVTVGANTLFLPYGNPLVVNSVLYLPDGMNNRVLGFNSVPTTNNAFADFVLGQPNFTTNTSGNTSVNLFFPASVKYYNGKLIVGDLMNNRVLIWNTVPTTFGVPSDVVVGQTGFATKIFATTKSSLSTPSDIEVVNGKLIVSDRDNNRILIWNNIPTTNGVSADLVLGQGDFNHNAINGGNSTPTASNLFMPYGLWSDGTRLVVTDFSNNRVLIWNTFPTTNGAPADLVLGQSDFTHNLSNGGFNTPTASTLQEPSHVTSNGTQLFLSDTYNNRVLIWNTFPTANAQPADRVLGQSDFTHNSSNVGNFIPSARTLSLPSGLYLFEKKLLVIDYSNNRCLFFQAR